MTTINKMILTQKFPSYASGNADFITKRTDLEPGDKVIVTDIDADSLPTGTLCLHPSTVKMMVELLGWELRTAKQDAEMLAMKQELMLAHDRLATFDVLLGAIETAITTQDVMA